MRKTAAALAVVAGLGLGGCDGVSTGPAGDRDFAFDLSEDAQGWTAEFVDYREGEAEAMELQAGHRALPGALSGGGFLLSGNNASDDLFMFVKRRVVGLASSATYSVAYEVTFATDVPAGCAGVGGAPGESVWVKAGASTDEPEVVLDELGWRRLDVDKGNQAVGGEQAVVLGNVASSTPCGQEREWELKTVSGGGDALTVTTDAQGRAWLFVGTESGFEATTSIYITRIGATFGR